ncbi:SDR family oxidoreductase [Mesorhizobium argentiipisi]|uniref:SDR family oxidoreductase n=1 Tax=Mesorhizobium argentiipisi TaxID=3015175 RepID=A0ABU8KCH5_9HYPH
MDLGISGRVALVTGAGGGLGSAIALELARAGVKVALADINTETLDKATAAIAAVGGTGVPVLWDIGDLSRLQTNISAIEDKLGGIDIVINNTGGPPPTPVAGQDAASWTKNFQSMVLSVIGITDCVLPGMMERKWGRVITSTSSGVVAPIPNLGLSNALRIALVGWSKTLAREVGGKGITANIILPGRIATDRILFLDEAKAKREGRSVEDVRLESTSSIPLGRYGRPAEYADVVSFLASERASYITGSVLRVDGGLIASI